MFYLQYNLILLEALDRSQPALQALAGLFGAAGAATGRKLLWNEPGVFGKLPPPMIPLRKTPRSLLKPPRLSARAWRWSMLGLLPPLLVAVGCAPGNWRGKGFGDQEGSWAQKMRPAADEKQFSGLDARAQEIERNLGVR